MPSKIVSKLITALVLAMLAALAVTLKIRIETPEGRQPLARAIVTNHLQAVNRDLALP